MRRTIVGLFKSRTQAERALREIELSGYANSYISIVMKNTPDTGQDFNEEYAMEITNNPAKGLLHDFDSFLVQAPTVELDEVGPVTAAGPIAEDLLQDNNSLSLAISHYGVSKERARELQQAVADGLILTVIETDNSKASKVANTLSGYGAFGVEKWSKSNDKPLHQWNAD